VSILRRSASGPCPRSSPWWLTLALPTSGCPLSTTRVRAAMSDLASLPTPTHSDPRTTLPAGEPRQLLTLLGPQFSFPWNGALTCRWALRE
ncbi:hypothetical protein HPG69_000983, partial [Diceros bicornis minor]